MRRDPIASFAHERVNGQATTASRCRRRIARDRRDPARPVAHDCAHLGHRSRRRNVARARGTLQRPHPARARPSSRAASRLSSGATRSTRCTRCCSGSRTEDFSDDCRGAAAPSRPRRGRRACRHPHHRPQADRATARRRSSSAAHPVWVARRRARRGRRGADEATRCSRERNRAFERLFNIVLAVTARRIASRSPPMRRGCRRASAGCATRRSSAIDAEGRVRAPRAGSHARDEIGDLSRSFCGVLARLAEYATYRRRWRAGSRTSCARRSPWSAARSTTSVRRRRSPAPTRACIWSARREGLARLSQILTRMTEAARLEQSLSDDAEREPFDARPAWSRAASTGYRSGVSRPREFILARRRKSRRSVDGAPDLDRADARQARRERRGVRRARTRPVDVRVDARGRTAR